MRVAVLIKAAPADPRSMGNGRGGVRRVAGECVMNLADVFALETALTLKGRLGAGVDAFTMGPAFVSSVLTEARALGADRLFLISDPAFAGADSYATARVLAAAVRGKYDLVLCGERSVDGETGQVPGELSALLGLPCASGVTGLLSVGEESVTCLRLTENGEDTLLLPLPGVLGISCGMTGVAHPAVPSLEGLRAAGRTEAELLTPEVLGLCAEEIGAAGSRTEVCSAMTPEWERDCRRAANLSEGVRLTIDAVG